ncbi:MAG: VWA-like domain-containing protein [Granulosicoccus sp.]
MSKLSSGFMEEAPFSYQLDANGHRGTRAIQRLVEYAPASGGLALWMQHRDVQQVPSRVQFADTDNRHSQKRWIIGNDGKTLFYGPAFIERSLEEQTGLVAHQVLHVALRHVDRQHQLNQRLGDIDSELFAVCADAIVNASLSHLTWLSLPDGSVTLDTLLLHVLGIEQPLDVSLHRWDTESLYRAIDDRQNSGGSTAQQKSGNDQSGEDASSTRTNTGQTENTENSEQNSASATSFKPSGQSASIHSDTTDGPKANAARQLAATIIRDLIPTASQSPETRTEQAMQWNDRLLRAHAVDGEQSFMRQLLADNVKPGTPWEHILRTRLQRALSLQSDVNWSRPTRSWIANRGRTSNGNRLPWQPGTSYSRNAPRLCIMVDVSGSVNDKLMQRFANEIDRIVRTYRTEVMLIIGDDKVREQHILKHGVSELRSITFKGGGGTDFIPLINAASKFNPDIGLFLTDLEGPAGDAPVWPIVWAVPSDSTAQPVPYGQRIILD